MVPTEFFMELPFYFLVASNPSGNFDVHLCERIADGAKGISLFTEEMHAEKCRDAWRSDGTIIPVATREAFVESVRHFVQHLKVTHVAVDPQPAEGTGAQWIACEDILA